ncbi:MAG: substrate-binding domain-containing protein [Gemmatimonadota bacterium]
MRNTLLWALCFAACADSEPARERLILGTTHTVEDSGLLEVLVAAFDSARTTHALSAVVAGSGEVLAMARNGDVDVLLTHSPDDEVAFIAGGHGESRQPVAHNDFVLVGPVSDPASAGSAPDVIEALRRMEADSALFISRGDDSGTHRRERALWAHAQTVPQWSGYIEAGTGMADLLRIASQRRAYALADRATFEVLRGELELRVMQEGDPRMRNEYSVIVVRDARNIEGARYFAEWLRSTAVRALIGGFGRARTGRPLFIPS